MHQQLFTLLCVWIFVQFAVARPSASNPQESPHKGYHFAYSSKDGTRREESGSFKYIKENEPILYVKGFYSYFDGTGREYKIHYEADDKGSRTSGDIIPPLPPLPPLPTLPPLPPYIPHTTPPSNGTIIPELGRPPQVEPLPISSAALASLAG